VPRRRHYRTPDSELLRQLVRVNRELGRLGCAVLLPVEDAKTMPDYQVREWVTASEDRVVTVRDALKGYRG